MSFEDDSTLRIKALFYLRQLCLVGNQRSIWVRHFYGHAAKRSYFQRTI